jgi:hypothetical protein
MIGSHPDVAMLHEHFGLAINEVVAKSVVGNKLCIPNHIELRKRRARWVNLLPPHFFHLLHRYSYFDRRPEAQLSLEDYIELQHIRVIGIARDGNLAVSSMMRRGNISEQLAIYRWSRSIEILSFLKAHLKRRFHIVLFKHLVNRPEDIMRQIASFLELPFHKSMLEGYKHTPNYSTQQIDSTKSQKSELEDLGLKTRIPDTYRKYESLCERIALHGKN